jgi:polyferredoxin
MNKFKIIIVLLCFLLLGAHYLRLEQMGMLILMLSFPVLLLFKRMWADLVLSIALLLGGILWIFIALSLIKVRISLSEPWMRLLVILSFVTLITFYGSYLMWKAAYSKNNYSKEEIYIPSFFAFLITFLLFLFVRWRVSFDILMFDRFFQGLGLIQIFLLSSYSAWITERMMNKDNVKSLRLKIWSLFSFVFFLQFILGVSGLDVFLMTGNLHVPVPAVILGGPIFRGSGFFMPILFTTTLLIAGPAWCSYFCYIGAWDNLFSQKRDVPDMTFRSKLLYRFIILFIVVAAAIGLRLMGVSGINAAFAAIFFGIIGVGIMAFISRKRGVMVHCVSYCPIGLIGNFLGKLSPFKVRINSSCNQCMACRQSCRYGALTKENIVSGKPGLTCTLCGDCLSYCKENAIHYTFPFINNENSRRVFIVVVVIIHTICLGIARI